MAVFWTRGKTQGREQRVHFTLACGCCPCHRASVLFLGVVALRICPADTQANDRLPSVPVLVVASIHQIPVGRVTLTCGRGLLVGQPTRLTTVLVGSRQCGVAPAGLPAGVTAGNCFPTGGNGKNMFRGDNGILLTDSV